MKITKKDEKSRRDIVSLRDVEYVAKLARLALTEEEKDKFCNQLNQILLYMEKLNELDTKDVPPTSHVLPLKNVWREDEVKPFSQVKEIVENAPEREGNYFKVKKIIE